MKLSHRLSAVCLSAVLLTGIAASAQVSPGVAVAPTRIEFKKDLKSKIVVRNPSQEKQTYRVEMLDLRMDEKGSFKSVTEAVEGLKSAKNYIRYSPRSFTLEPQSSQTVRLQLRTPREIEDGEYRTHLRVQALPAATPPKTDAGDKVAINVKINYGVTIPVIYRKGELDYTLSIDKAQLTESKGKAVIKASITRGGTRSAYGDLRVRKKGSETPLVFMPGTSIYSPLTTRNYLLNLEGSAASYAGEELIVEYIDRETGKVKASQTVTR